LLADLYADKELVVSFGGGAALFAVHVRRQFGAMIVGHEWFLMKIIKKLREGAGLSTHLLLH
jgi:hypothetical protein